MAQNNNSGSNLRCCSFCGRNEHQVMFLIPSPNGAYICDACVEACSELIDEQLNRGADSEFTPLSPEALPVPKEIKATLKITAAGVEITDRTAPRSLCP